MPAIVLRMPTFASGICWACCKDYTSTTHFKGESSALEGARLSRCAAVVCFVERRSDLPAIFPPYAYFCLWDCWARCNCYASTTHSKGESSALEDDDDDGVVLRPYEHEAHMRTRLRKRQAGGPRKVGTLIICL